MSSLLQFRGKIDKKGVHIEVYKTIPSRKDIEFSKDNPYHPSRVVFGANWEETFICSKCGNNHPILHTFARKPKGMFGCWVVFRYNGEDYIPDLSCPFGMDKLPIGSKKMTVEESAEAWHK
jgi:hypothetical protein